VRVNFPVVLAGADALAAAYLLVSLRRERRNRSGVLVVGLLLVGCVVALVVLSWPGQTQRRPVLPSTPVTSTGPGQAV
jgi:hypothetical protein